MKKLVILALALLLVPLALAANSYDLNDFSLEPNQAVWLSPGDEVRFELLGGVHSLFVENISAKDMSADIKIFPFRTKANYITLTKGKNHLKADFDKDRKDDLIISLFEVKNGKAMIYFEKIKKPAQIDNTTNVEPQGQGVVKEKDNTVYYIAVVIVILTALVIWLNVKGKKKKKK